MSTVVTIIGGILCLLVVPIATVLGLLGLWMGDAIGCFVGVVVGLLWQAGS